MTQRWFPSILLPWLTLTAVSTTLAKLHGIAITTAPLMINTKLWKARPKCSPSRAWKTLSNVKWSPSKWVKRPLASSASLGSSKHVRNMSSYCEWAWYSKCFWSKRRTASAHPTPKAQVCCPRHLTELLRSHKDVGHRQHCRDGQHLVAAFELGPSQL